MIRETIYQKLRQSFYHPGVLVENSFREVIAQELILLHV